MLAGIAAAQDVRYNYDKDADFTKYKTYKWVEIKASDKDDLIDKQIRATIDVVFRAVGSRTIDTKAKPEKRQKNLAKALQKMLEEYPPKPQKGLDLPLSLRRRNAPPPWREAGSFVVARVGFDGLGAASSGGRWAAQGQQGLLQCPLISNRLRRTMDDSCSPIFSPL